MTEKNDEYLIDALGNRLRVYSHISGYVGIGYFVEKNDVEACKMFLTMGKYNHKLIQYIQFYNMLRILHQFIFLDQFIFTRKKISTIYKKNRDC